MSLTYVCVNRVNDCFWRFTFYTLSFEYRVFGTVPFVESLSLRTGVSLVITVPSLSLISSDCLAVNMCTKINAVVTVGSHWFGIRNFASFSGPYEEDRHSERCPHSATSLRHTARVWNTRARAYSIELTHTHDDVGGASGVATSDPRRQDAAAAAACPVPIILLLIVYCCAFVVTNTAPSNGEKP